MKVEQYDVVVVGGGPSGVMAAVQSARAGAKTLLIERGGFLGGSLTMMGVSPMMTFHNPGGDQVVFGLAQELVDKLIAMDASPGHVIDSITYCSTVTPFDAEAMKIAMETMVIDAGADILYHSMLASVSFDQSRVQKVTVCNKAGLVDIVGQYFIDATGDGDLANQAGIMQKKGRETDEATQPMTMNLKISGVDVDRIREDVYANPDNYEFDLGVEEGIKRLKETKRLSLKAFSKTWPAYRDQHQLGIPREFILFFETNEPGTVVCNSSRIQGMDGTNPFDMTRAEVEGRRQCYEIFKFLKSEAIGFENARLVSTPYQVGVRETRRSIGDYVLTASDLLEQRPFDDVVAFGAYPIDIHSPDKIETVSTHLQPDHVYNIPMRTLFTGKVDNLVFSGRSISADHEAFAAIRVTPIAMSIGQASGAVAAVAARHHCAVNRVPYEEVKQALKENGVRL
ncbi:FAD-dependent oxidoreductase [Reinekea blandensis]|uniref:FAD dependent oxidoreductase n=1 Tax=Reinekea blandensis MED297 TaxID=314283 RepID=A4BAU7_9GAMM|nr:FAD-dependent oxidoreductase [Reinekea blandensis]EAR10560.1 hypothetical protein MED297_11110 [Reinekea sp. MED297] [Reinekea blandensis MED297]